MFWMILACVKWIKGSIIEIKLKIQEKNHCSLVNHLIIGKGNRKAALGNFANDVKVFLG